MKAMKTLKMSTDLLTKDRLEEILIQDEKANRKTSEKNYHSLALCLQRLKDYKGSAKILRVAISHFPQHANFLKLLGMALLAEYECTVNDITYKERELILRESFSAFSTSVKSIEMLGEPSVWWYFSQVYMAYGSYEGALKVLSHLITNFPTFENKKTAIFKASICLTKIKRYNEAVEYVKWLINDEDLGQSEDRNIITFDELHIFLAMIYKLKGEHDIIQGKHLSESGVMFEKSIQSFKDSKFEGLPNKEEAWVILGEKWEKDKHYLLSIDALENAKSICKYNGNIVNLAKYNLSICRLLLLTNAYKEAWAMANEAMATGELKSQCLEMITKSKQVCEEIDSIKDVVYSFTNIAMTLPESIPIHEESKIKVKTIGKVQDVRNIHTITVFQESDIDMIHPKSYDITTFNRNVNSFIKEVLDLFEFKAGSEQEILECKLIDLDSNEEIYEIDKLQNGARILIIPPLQVHKLSVLVNEDEKKDSFSKEQLQINDSTIIFSNNSPSFINLNTSEESFSYLKNETKINLINSSTINYNAERTTDMPTNTNPIPLSPNNSNSIGGDKESPNVKTIEMSDFEILLSSSHLFSNAHSRERIALKNIDSSVEEDNNLIMAIEKKSPIKKTFKMRPKSAILPQMINIVSSSESKKMHKDFLWGERGMPNSDIEYLKAIEKDQTNFIKISSYASFLSKYKTGWDRAERYFLRAIELSQKYKKYQRKYICNLASLYTQMDQKKKASELLEKAFSMGGNQDSYVLYSIAKLYESNCNAKLARDFFMKSIKLDPSFCGSLTKYANLLLHSFNDIENAEVYYGRAMNCLSLIRDDNESIYETLISYAHFLIRFQGDLYNAEKLLRECIEMYPLELNALSLLGNLLLTYKYKNKSTRREVFDIFRRILDLKPKDVEGSLGMASLLIRKNNQVGRLESIKIYKQLISLYPENIKVKLIYATFLDYELGNIQEAKTIYDNIIEMSHKVETNSISSATLICNVLNSYAAFLDNRIKDFGNARIFYKKAIELYENKIKVIGSKLFSLLFEFANFLAKISTKENNSSYMNEAITSLHKVLSFQPMHSNSLCLLANLHHRNFKIVNEESYPKNLIEECEKLYQKAISTQPISAYTLNSYAAFQILIKFDVKTCESLLSKALQINKNDSKILVAYGIIQLHVYQNLAYAEKILSSAIKENPEEVEGLSSLANCYELQNGDINTIETLYKTSIRLDPLNVLSLLHFGLFLSKHYGKFGEAQEYMKKALKINPKESYTHYMIGNFFYDYLNKIEPALEHWNVALELDEGNILAAYRLGKHFENIKRWKEAQDCYIRALEYKNKQGLKSSTHKLLLSYFKNDSIIIKESLSNAANLKKKDKISLQKSLELHLHLKKYQDLLNVVDEKGSDVKLKIYFMPNLVKIALKNLFHKVSDSLNESEKKKHNLLYLKPLAL